MKHFIILSTFLLVPLAVNAQPDTLWTRTFGYAYSDSCSAGQSLAFHRMAVRPDGIVIVAGRRTCGIVTGYPPIPVVYHFDTHYAICDSSGAILSESTLDDNTDVATIALANEDRFLVVTASGSGCYFRLQSDFHGIVTPQGEIVCQESISFGPSIPLGGALTSDGGMILGGYRDFNCESNARAIPILYKLSASCELEWARSIDWWELPGYFVITAGIWDVRRNAAGDIFACGRWFNYTDGDVGFIVEFSPSGDTLQTMRLPGAPPRDFALRDDGHFYYVANYAGAPLTLLDSSGDTVWTRSYGLIDHLQVLPDNGVLALFHQPRVIRRITADGDSVWTWIPPNGAIVNQINIDQHGHFFAAGSNASNTSMVLMMGNHGAFAAAGDTRSVPLFSSLTSYPNPFNPSTTISFSLPKAGEVSLKVYDVTGREVETLAEKRYEAGEHAVTFDGSVLPSGIYFARINAGVVTQTQKMVLLK